MTAFLGDRSVRGLVQHSTQVFIAFRGATAMVLLRTMRITSWIQALCRGSASVAAAIKDSSFAFKSSSVVISVLICLSLVLNFGFSLDCLIALCGLAVSPTPL